MLDDFSSSRLDILVVTDIAARGLHIPAVTHIFNDDWPDDYRNYVHRIGRTGRMSASGHALPVNQSIQPRGSVVPFTGA